MSRYLLLVLLNLPLIIAGLVGALVDYKMKKTSLSKYLLQTSIWIIIFIGLASAKFIYDFLFSNNLTETEPLSLFDVILFTGLVFVLFTANRARIKNDRLERRIQDLHQELSIELSKNKLN